MEKIRENGKIESLFREIAGSVCVAAGICNFAVQAKFPMSGFSGISILLYRLLGIPVGWSIILLNIPVAFFCGRMLGRRFLISSLWCMALSSVLIDYAAPLFPVYEGSRLLAALCTGTLTGMGYALIYMQGASTGGMDFIVMAIKRKRPYLSIGKILLGTDLAVVAAGGILLRDMDGVIYGAITAWLASTVIDKLMYGMNAGKMALIVTNRAQEICRVIDGACGRGSTVLSGYGGYQGDERKVVMCVCSNKEMYALQKAAKQKDPKAFMIIMESSEVHGKGFQSPEPG